MSDKSSQKKIKTKTITEKIIPTDDELILGAKPEIKTVKVVDYTSVNRLYKVTNIQKNRVYQLNGIQIGAILGMNQSARDDLKQGKSQTEITKVVRDGERTKIENLYKIEVIE